MQLSEQGDVVERLLPYVRPYVGSAGGGSYSFRVLCSVSTCHRLDTISGTRISLVGERQHRKACEKLVAQGWSCDELPLCPDCHRRKRDRAAHTDP